MYDCTQHSQFLPFFRKEEDVPQEYTLLHKEEKNNESKGRREECQRERSETHSYSYSYESRARCDAVRKRLLVDL